MKRISKHPREYDWKATYLTSEGYSCETVAAMVRHVLKTMQSNANMFIICKDSAHSQSLCKGLLNKRIPASLHGGSNVCVNKPYIALEDAIYMFQFSEES